MSEISVGKTVDISEIVYTHPCIECSLMRCFCNGCVCQECATNIGRELSGDPNHVAVPEAIIDGACDNPPPPAEFVSMFPNVKSYKGESFIPVPKK